MSRHKCFLLWRQKINKKIKSQTWHCVVIAENTQIHQNKGKCINTEKTHAVIVKTDNQLSIGNTSPFVSVDNNNFYVRFPWSNLQMSDNWAVTNE